MTTFRRVSLPYEILKTACELFAGKTGFSQEEMKTFFSEEIQKVAPRPNVVYGGSFWGSLGNVLDQTYYDQKLRPGSFPTRAKALEYWLSFLPLSRQKELLLNLCQNPDFPMSCGKPSSQQRERLIRLLTDIVLDPYVSEVLQRLNSSVIMHTWQKMIERCEDDPQGAITAARSLLETTCKLLLDECSCVYNERADLPELYSLLARQLHIAPSEQTEMTFRRVFGGCHTIIEGLGTLRNQLGDAHGKRKTSPEPMPYHALFVVNLAGATAMFLVQTWEAYQQTT